METLQILNLLSNKEKNVNMQICLIKMSKSNLGNTWYDNVVTHISVGKENKLKRKKKINKGKIVGLLDKKIDECLRL